MVFFKAPERGGEGGRERKREETLCVCVCVCVCERERERERERESQPAQSVRVLYSERNRAPDSYNTPLDQYNNVH